MQEVESNSIFLPVSSGGKRKPKRAGRHGKDADEAQDIRRDDASPPQACTQSPGTLQSCALAQRRKHDILSKKMW